MVGVDALQHEQNGMLHIFVSDLYNVRQELFEDVVAVASCTGTRVGPQDDPDRSKYFQGVKFYAPVVLADSPENVEYRGLKNLIDGARKHFDAINRVDTLPVLEFTDREKVASQWGPLDDVVMGGVSESNLSVRDSQLIFSGFVSTDNRGGFTSARTVTFDTPMDLSAYNGIDLRVKGDGQSYKLIIRCDQNWDGVSHCYTFPTVNGVWEEVRVPFSEFRTVFRAKTLKKGQPLNPKRIFAFQIMLSKFEYDGNLNDNFNPGRFQLCIGAISAYTEQEHAGCPKVVHIGSAATTRPLRTDEQFEEVPPAVKLNEQLGKLLNWKLAGEDSLRVSGIPYCILRPTALTEEETVGLNRLVFDQGDNITGRVGRDDVADLILKAFDTPGLTNVTTEVAIAEDDVENLGTADERIKRLTPDEEESRSFAPFPYVPDSKPSEETVA
ncbi:Complex I intermediate-associated protein 30 mitochondrial [Gracilaria domingensis]|nr:Complex I intermediate-associated protein 30 mitochondrial [Gracilaria domingensis]